MPDKVELKLRPYTALAILTFCREYINDSNKDNPNLAAIQESVSEYEAEIFKKMNTQQIEDAILENKINALANRHPDNYGR